MNLAFPVANVKFFEVFISGINLRDKDDRHVVACAIRCNADVIVTFNIKDFSTKELAKFGLAVTSFNLTKGLDFPNNFGLTNPDPTLPGFYPCDRKCNKK